MDVIIDANNQRDAALKDAEMKSSELEKMKLLQVG